ncbi:MAG: ribose-phosphate pyrophosphokinase [Clostridia bacterium]|nr:ribose-phosphate pyrophosphokinase [Clostridia bacterium]
MNGQPISMFDFQNNYFPIGIIAMESARELAKLIDEHLMSWYYEEHPEAKDKEDARKSLIIKSSCPRFNTGDAKAVLGETVRGYDIYIVTDVGNYNCTYTMYGKEVMMSPDDHYQDLKRVISAISGKAQRITVIMPTLYGGRQHKRSSRESLDAAHALQELQAMGVSNILTFDAHDPRVQNATPLMGFDNAMPNYQVLKALFKKVPDLKIDKDHLMIVSPDEGAMNRNIFYSSMMGLDLGMFYKRRDFTRIVNGRNPIIAHEYLGAAIEGKDVFVSDDIVASGDSLLSLAYDLKKEGAKRIYLSATYALFTEGIERFHKAYAEGMFDGLLATNLTYQSPEMLNAPWFINVDVSKYVAYFILASHQHRSVTTILNSHEKIQKLIEKYVAEQKERNEDEECTLFSQS